MREYDYLIVGSGLFGAVFAHEASKKGKKCLVIEKRDHTGGNIYCEEINGITVHKYGAHIFHTNSRRVWNYVNDLCEFNRYTNSPIANYHGELYNMPFNMNTFNKLWGVVTPAEAQRKIAEQRTAVSGEPSNLEEQAIRLVGTDLYEKLVKGYTENSGAGIVKICLPSSSKGFRSALRMITIILTIRSREFRRADTTESRTSCWKALRSGSAWISTLRRKIARIIKALPKKPCIPVRSTPISIIGSARWNTEV